MQKIISHNLSTMSPEEQAKLVDGLKQVPLYKIHEQSQYLINQLLPAVESKKGIDSEDYKFFKGLVDSLCWAVLILDRFERMSYQLSNERMLREFFQNKAVFLEQQLTKYTTMEDLVLGQSYEAMKRAVAARTESLISK
jgi:hypothetical protein